MAVKTTLYKETTITTKNISMAIGSVKVLPTLQNFRRRKGDIKHTEETKGHQVALETEQ